MCCINPLQQGLQTFLSEGHTTYYTSGRGLDTLRNVSSSGYATFAKSTIFL